MDQPQAKRTFASDNNAGIHPRVLAAIAQANTGHMLAYGDDAYSKTVLRRIEGLFGKPAEAFFVFNGTAANVLSIATLTRPHHAVICAATSHIHVDECGAPENFTGCKLLPLPTSDGKLTPAIVSAAYHGVGNQHHVQPRLISISQSTEMGTVYTPREIRALADFAHEREMFLHVDGARIANALVSTQSSPEEMIGRAGVDAISFGGTKNGLLLGEAVVLLRPELTREFPYVRKQAMQLASKMRFIACQFEALLEGDLWLENARHANAMARLLGECVAKVPGVKVTQPVQSNGVFARIPQGAIAPLQQHSFFWIWDEQESVVRWMTSFDTTPEDVQEFAARLREILAKA